MLLENAFVNKVVLILKKNGKNDQPFILFDRIGIPDGNIIEYLENLEKTIAPPIIVVIPDKLKDDGYNNFNSIVGFSISLRLIEWII